jgi:hypothetical protein
MASERPEYNSKISLAQTMVGAAFIEGSTFPMVFERYLRRIEVRFDVFFTNLIKITFHFYRWQSEL